MIDEQISRELNKNKSGFFSKMREQIVNLGFVSYFHIQVYSFKIQLSL